MLNMFRLADWEGKFVVVASRPHPPRAHIPIDTESAVPTFHHSTSLRLLSCPKASGACAFPSPRCRHQPLLSPPSSPSVEARTSCRRLFSPAPPSVLPAVVVILCAATVYHWNKVMISSGAPSRSRRSTLNTTLGTIAKQGVRHDGGANPTGAGHVEEEQSTNELYQGYDPLSILMKTD
jgi:hypothetical protein